MGIEYIIEKVSLDQRPDDIPPNFPRIPSLYLELLENKRKVKPDLVNKDYVPPDVSNTASDTIFPEEKKTHVDKPHDSAIDDMELTDEDAKSEVSTATNEIKDDESIKTTCTTPPNSVNERRTTTSSHKKLLKILGKEKVRTPALSERTPKALFEKGGQTPKVDKRLPTLSELEKQNGIKRDKIVIESERISDKDEDLKRDILLKFNLLRRTYPRATIPTVSIHEDYKVLERQYETTLKNLSIDNSVDNYKQYLTFLFMGIEWFCGKVLKMDMEGYTDHQCEQMHKYEEFLVQIGEKNYLPSGKQWPVEIRLLVVVVIQTALFVLMRSVFKNAGASILKKVNEAKVPSPIIKGKKMRGPNVKVSDLPSVSEISQEQVLDEIEKEA